MNKSENIIAIVCGKAMPILNEYQQRILAGCLADGYRHGENNCKQTYTGINGKDRVYFGPAARFIN